jgi:amino acid transporter
MSLGVWASVSPTLGQQFGELIAVSVILTLLLYIYAAGALWREARRDPARARADRAFAAAAVCFCTFVLVFSGATMLLWSAAVLLAAAPLYFLIRTRGPRGGGPPPAKATQASRGNLETP